MFSGASVFHQQDARRGFARDAGHAGIGHRRASVFRSGRSRPGVPHGAGRYRGLLPAGLLQHQRRARRPLAHAQACASPACPARASATARATTRAKDFGVFTTEDRERQLEDAMPLGNAGRGAARRRGNGLFPARQEPDLRAHLREARVQRAAMGAEEQPPPGAISISPRKFATPNPTAWWARCATPSPSIWTPNASSSCSRTPCVYQGGIILPPGDYKLKFLARENETGRIGTFEDELKLPAAAADHLQLSSVVLSSQLVKTQKDSEVQTKAFAPNAKLKESPLDVAGPAHHSQRDPRLHRQQMLYIFFQAYVPEKRRSEQSARRDRTLPQRRAASIRRRWSRRRKWTIRRTPLRSASACRSRACPQGATRLRRWLWKPAARTPPSAATTSRCAPSHGRSRRLNSCTGG